MSLTSAHAGYAYQDLLCSYFILEEIISENDSAIRIDQKEVNDDRFDDIVIKNKSGVFRKQVKYSDSKDDGHTLTKDDLARDGNYNLALHNLFKSWESYPENERGDLKVCLSWNSPDSSDAILDVLRQIDSSSFDTFNTTTYCIDIDKLWVPGKRPLDSWRKFKNESVAIQRDDFSKFIQAFVIEVNLPKASLDIYSPGELERILIEQVRRLGVGEYPNHELNIQETILALTQIVTKARARGITLNTSQVLRQLRIKTDYGRIEQVFPVNSAKLIETKNSVNVVKKAILDNSKVIITGEPGSGKSWFINNLESSLKEKFLVVSFYE